jgi:hypothetical protein
MLNTLIALIPSIALMTYSQPYGSFNGFEESNYSQFISLNSVDIKKADAYFESCLVNAAVNNNPTKAMAHCNIAISLNPQLANAYCWRGSLKYYRFNKQSSGVSDVRKCAKLARKQGDSKVLGYALQALARWGVSE